MVDEYLVTEMAHQRIAGPFDVDLPGIMINRFGVIPKFGKPGKWRLIVDLSAPAKFSINDGVSKTDASMVYSSVADAARMILSHWPRLISLMPSELSRCTPMIGICWA